MIIFFCPTKYTLINCLHIKRTSHPGDKAILFLFDQNNVLSQIAERLRKDNIFEDIIFVPITRGTNAVARWIYTLTDLLGFDKKYGRMLSEMDCPIIYTHGNNFALDVIHKNLVKKNPGLQWIMYDEGIGSYMNNPDNDYSGKAAAALKLLSLIRPKLNRKIMLYTPELDLVQRNYSVEALKKINLASHDFVDYCNRIFDYTDVKYDYSCIYFSQPMYDYRLSVDEMGCLRNLERDILLSVQAEFDGSLAVKPHPRDRDKLDYCKFIKDYNPYELVLLNQDFSEKILITINSTAVTTPKTVFDKEPRVIVLNSLFRSFLPETETTLLTRIFNGVKKYYSDPTRFFIPETKEELMEYVKNLKP